MSGGAGKGGAPKRIVADHSLGDIPADALPHANGGVEGRADARVHAQVLALFALPP